MTATFVGVATILLLAIKLAAVAGTIARIVIAVAALTLIAGAIVLSGIVLRLGRRSPLP